MSSSVVNWFLRTAETHSDVVQYDRFITGQIHVSVLRTLVAGTVFAKTFIIAASGY